MTETVAPMMTEAQLQTTVEGLLRFYGWRYFHAPDNRPVQARSGRRYVQKVTPGFPDIIALRNLPGYGAEMLVAELKKQSGRYGDGQQEWLDAFEALMTAVQASGKAASHEIEIRDLPGVGVYTWRPADLISGEIDRVLCGPAGPGVMVGTVKDGT